MGAWRVPRDHCRPGGQRLKPWLVMRSGGQREEDCLGMDAKVNGNEERVLKQLKSRQIDWPPLPDRSPQFSKDKNVGVGAPVF